MNRKIDSSRNEAAIPRLLRFGAVIALAALAVGCASVDVGERQVLAPLEGLPRPPVALVYDFAIDANDVVVDTFGPAIATGEGEPSERLEFARKVQDALARSLVQKLNAKGVPARRAAPSARPALDALLVKGQFLTVDEGDAMGRTVIGFGAGSSELRIQLQVYQMTRTGPRQLIANRGSAEGSKRPGMLVPVAGGAALGKAATAAVVSGSVNVASEISGAINNDVERLTEEIAERAVQFYIDRGWATSS